MLNLFQHLISLYYADEILKQVQDDAAFVVYSVVISELIGVHTPFSQV